MTISGQAGMSLLDSILSAQSARTEAGVTMLKKAQDVEKQQGQAIVELLESAGNTPSVPASPVGSQLDVYA